MSVVGAAVSATGSLVQGFRARQAGRAANAQAKVDAFFAKQEGAVGAEIALNEGARAVGAAVARSGASGFTIDGSALDVVASLAQDAAFNAQKSFYESGRRAGRLRAAGRAAKRAGTNALIRGGFQAAGSLITGIANSQSSQSSGGP